MKTFLMIFLVFAGIFVFIAGIPFITRHSVPIIVAVAVVVMVFGLANLVKPKKDENEKRRQMAVKPTHRRR